MSQKRLHVWMLCVYMVRVMFDKFTIILIVIPLFLGRVDSCLNLCLNHLDLSSFVTFILSWFLLFYWLPHMPFPYPRLFRSLLSQCSMVYLLLLLMALVLANASCFFDLVLLPHFGISFTGQILVPLLLLLVFTTRGCYFTRVVVLLLLLIGVKLHGIIVNDVNCWWYCYPIQILLLLLLFSVLKSNVVSLLLRQIPYPISFKCNLLKVLPIPSSGLYLIACFDSGLFSMC